MRPKQLRPHDEVILDRRNSPRSHRTILSAAAGIGLFLRPPGTPPGQAREGTSRLRSRESILIDQVASFRSVTRSCYPRPGLSLPGLHTSYHRPAVLFLLIAPLFLPIFLEISSESGHVAHPRPRCDGLPMGTPEIGKNVSWIYRARGSDELCKFEAGIRIWMVGATMSPLGHRTTQGIEFAQKAPNAYPITVVLPPLSALH